MYHLKKNGLGKLWDYINMQIHKATMIRSRLRKKFINPHMHKLGPRGPTHYTFGD